MPRARSQSTQQHPQPGQQELPIQPVENPILCNPYAEPTEHWIYDKDTGEASRFQGRRPASYWYKTERSGQERQLQLIAEENRDDLPLVNALRDDVRRWRGQHYEGATTVTKQLLDHWWRADRYRRLFFCQLEAAETVIYLAELRAGGKRVNFKPAFEDKELAKLVDTPLEPGLKPMPRYACKMATGSGKTVVMAMLIAWSLCNRARLPSDTRFPAAALVVCPNLTVKERLQVLRPDNPENYYAAFDLVPAVLRPLMQQGKVMVTNWHLFAPESEHSDNGRSYPVVNKGEESNEAFARRTLGDLYAAAPLLVFNDEGHHAYRPAPLEEKERLAGEDAQRAKSDREEATVWVAGLDKINQACGIRVCVDMSATPFYIQGSGHAEGSPFPWLVSDFGLVDAIESGIVKIPRIPISDTTGRPEAKYFRLWRNITDNLQPGQRLPGRGRKPKPEAIWQAAEPALQTLMGQWTERFKYIQESAPGQDQTPPALIIVCDNTDIAELFYRNISGEQTFTEEAAEIDDADGEEGEAEPTPRRGRKPKPKVLYGDGLNFPEYFSNREGQRRTIRIDSKLLAEAEAGDGSQSRQDAAQDLRRLVATVGKPGEPGEQVRCVISVQMLSEGWDANNVTHIFGLRAFDSQLLCEQVVGRGLRRMDYTPDPATGRLTEEYVDVYGIPFSVIPFKGRPAAKAAPEDKPKWRVHAMPERQQFEIKFPVVEGYTFNLRRNAIRADVAAMESLELEPNLEPTAVFVKPTVGYQTGQPSALGPGLYEEQNRDAYYRSTHLQAIEFEIARTVVMALTDPNLAKQHGIKEIAASRHRLFPQVLRLVDEYVGTKVKFRGQHPCELGLQKYVQRVVDRLLTAIQPEESPGEQPLLPALNRYKPIGTTAEVDFKTIRPVRSTLKSHINQVVLDSPRWESAAAFYLEQSQAVRCYARNDQLEFTIPYEYLGASYHYEPDFLVKLADGTTLILEIKGFETDVDQAKQEAARRWIAAVNNWGQLGQWDFLVCRDPQALGRELEKLMTEEMIKKVA